MDNLIYLKLVVGLTLGFILVVFGVYNQIISKIQSTEFLTSKIEHLKKVMYSDPFEYVLIADQALLHYKNISKKAFSSKVVSKNSELFTALIQQIADRILVLDTDDNCQTNIITFSKNAQDVKKELIDIVWINNTKKIDHISRTLDKTAETMVVLWEKKTNEYVY